MASVSGAGNQHDLTRINAMLNQIQEGVEKGAVNSNLNNVLIELALIKNDLPSNIEVKVTELTNKLKAMNAQHEGQPRPSHEI